MSDDDLHFSRSGTSHLRKLTTDVKTRMSESEFVREIIRIRLYGLEHVQRIAAERPGGRGRKRGTAGTARGRVVMAMSAA